MRFVIVLAALHCLAFIDRTMIGGVLPLVRASVGMSDAQAGALVGTAFALPYGVAALTVAILRRGRPASTRWLIAGVMVWTAGSVATGLAGTLGALAVARALLGIGQGMFVPFAIARLLDATEPAERGRALGLFVGGATLGRSTALLLVGVLLSVLAWVTRDGIAAWRLLFVVTALPNLVVIVLLALIPGPVPVPAHVAAAADRAPWRTLLPFFPVAIAPVLLGQAVLSWLPTLFVRDRGLATADAALLIGAVTLVASPAGPILAGWLIGRHRTWERHTPRLVLAALAATLPLLAMMVRAPGLAGAIAAMIALLAVLGMASFGGLFGVQLLTPPGTRVSVNGVFLALVTVIGVGLGPLLTGVLAATDALGTALLTTGLAAVGVCALAVIGVRKSFGRGLRA